MLTSFILGDITINKNIYYDSITKRQKYDIFEIMKPFIPSFEYKMVMT